MAAHYVYQFIHLICISSEILSLTHDALLHGDKLILADSGNDISAAMPTPTAQSITNTTTYTTNQYSFYNYNNTPLRSCSINTSHCNEQVLGEYTNLSTHYTYDFCFCI